MAKAAGLPGSADLLALARREAEALAAQLAAAEPGHSVHGARRRIKQLRSLLRLLRPALGEIVFAAANGALRQAAQALAGQRRAEALVGAAAKLEASAGFWTNLATAHRAAHARDGDPVAELAAARAAITGAAAALAGAGPVAGDAASVAEAYVATYRTARRRLRRALASAVAEDLHEARKGVIHHLHHRQLLLPRGARRLDRLEALREVLGDLNDLDELEQLADGIAVAGADRKRMRKARRRLIGKAKTESARLFRHGPDRLRKRLGHAAAHVPVAPEPC